MTAVRLAIRSLRTTPVVTTVAVLSLALGIGASTAIFSLTNSLVLRKLPVKNAGALVLVTDPTVPGVKAYAFGVWDAFHRHVDVFDGTLAWSPSEFNLVPRGEAQIVSGAWVSGSFFHTLGVPPQLGRMLSEADDRRNGGADGPVAVISDAFWQRHYGSAADVVGRTLLLDGVSFTVVGVAPRSFSGLDVGRRADVFVPFGAATPGTSNLQVTIMARRRADQSLEAATAALRRVQPQIREAALLQGSRWRQQDLDAYLRDGFVLVPGATGHSRLRLRYQRPLGLLMAVVAPVLLIASANITNLLLAHATDRRQELRIRVALGASRWRLMRGLLTESLVIASLGAALGLAVASSASTVVVQQLSTRLNPIYLDVSIDSTVALFAIVTTGLITVLSGLIPAVRGTQVLQGGFGSIDVNQGRRSFGPSTALIVVQVAVSLVLIVGAGLFVKTFTSLAAVPLGFQPERVLMAAVSASDARVAPNQRLEMFQRVRDAVRLAPGVADAAFSFLTPVSGPILLRPIEGPDGASTSERDRLASVNLVSAGWFRTLGTPLVAGREFVGADRAGAPPVVVVNETFVRKFLNTSNPLGQVVRIGIARPNVGSAEVVGVARDAVYSSLRDPVPPTIYFPLAQLQSVPASLTLTVRTETATPLQMATSIAAAIATVDPDAALTFRPLTDQIDSAVAQERILALLSGFFGGFAVLLAGLGLFGITSYSVGRRRREIGIRMALGAAPASVIRSVIGRVSLLLAAGVVIGAGVSMWATQFTKSLLFGLEPRDPVAFGLAAVILVGAGLLAALPPAWHASRVDPSVALRSE